MTQFHFEGHSLLGFKISEICTIWQIHSQSTSQGHLKVKEISQKDELLHSDYGLSQKYMNEQQGSSSCFHNQKLPLKKDPRGEVILIMEDVLPSMIANQIIIMIPDCMTCIVHLLNHSCLLISQCARRFSVLNPSANCD